jgi:hypothetical protein
MVLKATVVSLLCASVAAAEIMPMYAAMPSQVALLHRKGDVSSFLQGGPNAFSTGAAVAVSDHVGLRVAGGYRPWINAENGWGTFGVMAYLSRPSVDPALGTSTRLRGLRLAVSLDVGAGKGSGRAEGYYSGRGITSPGGPHFLERYEGTYGLGQLNLDAGYEWRGVAVLGTLRSTYVNLFEAKLDARGGGNFYLEPMACVRLGPRALRFEARVGLTFDVDGPMHGGVQPWMLAVGVVGTWGPDGIDL